MRSLTLGLFYVVKTTELLLLSVLTGFIIFEAVALIEEIRANDRSYDNDMFLLALCAITIVICFYHLLYVNILINSRLYIKVKCKTFGLCTYDCINLLTCLCFLKKPCRDRCFTPWTIGKWVILGAIMGTTIGLTK